MVFPVVGGDGKPTGYEVSNSLRLTDNGYLNRTRSSPTDTKGTFSAWIKTAAQNSINLAGGASSVNDRAYIYFPSSGDGFSGGIFSRISGSANMNFSTSAVYRDPAAWYHLVVAIDSTQSTESNRVKWYVNGEQVTSFSSASYPSQNGEIPLFSKAAHTIGASYGASSISNWSDGYIAEVYYADGTQYAASDFGETNDNGVWVPKEAKDDISFGNEGFYLEFKQTGTGTNSSGIGADTSGNDNHLAVNNLAATDVTTDTPTNNFCTYNPLDVSGDENPAKVCTFSEGNTKLVQGNSSDVIGWAASTIGIRNGKWYFEIKLPTVGYQVFGIGPESWDGQDGAHDNVFHVYVDNGVATFRTGASGGQGSFSFSESNNDIWMFALDLDTPKLWFGVNGSWYNSGDPSAGSNPTSTQAITDTVFIKGSLYTQNRELLLNTGQPSFSISSGNADANGHGNFEYAPPSGFLSICTKNLAETG